MREIPYSWRPVPLLTCVFLLCTLQPMAVVGQVADMSAEEQRIVWHPAAKYRSVTLVVSGGGRIHEETFGSSSKPAFSLVDERGQALPDGTYSYTLNLVPYADGPTLAAQAKARESGDPDALARMAQRLKPASPTSQSGVFSLRGGKLVQPGEEKVSNRDRLAREGDLMISGNLDVTGAKRFVMADPAEPGVVLHFVALEGPEAGTYYRTTARLVDGEAVIELPESFRRATEPAGLTVQLTPIGGWSRLYVSSKSIERLVVRSADGDREIEFDILVHGVRKGFADHQPLRRRAVDPGR